MTSKKKPDLLELSKRNTPKEEISLTPGDIETYSFDFSIKSNTEHLYISHRKLSDTPTTNSENEIPSAEILLNEKIFTDLLSKYAKAPITSSNSPKTEVKKSASIPAGSPIKSDNAKDLTESLKRIIRYTNKRKYEERIGFATTIANKCEEIGPALTVQHLLPIIEKHMVF